ncbi:MAG: hypothetical protein ACO3DD_10940, partial [Burkholderiaceae bacterium]
MNGQFSGSASANIDVALPFFASIAGVDLVEDAALAPKILVKGNPLSSGADKLTFTGENFDQFSNLSRLSLTDVIAMVPGVLTYLSKVDVAALGLGQLPFLEQSLSTLVDLSGAFDREVVSQLKLTRDPEPWRPTASEKQKATGSATISAARDQIQGSAGQFSSSMLQQYVSVEGASRLITAVSADGSTLTIGGDPFVLKADSTLTEDQTPASTSVDYLVHYKIQPIKTLDEFVAALNDSGLLGQDENGVANVASYNGVTKELRIPVRFQPTDRILTTAIDLGLGGDNQDIALATSATAA